MTTTQGTPGQARADHAGDRQTFELSGRRVTGSGGTDIQHLLAAAHADRVRPLCLCQPDGIAMYVAKIGADRYVIKRMPDTGLAHHHRCASYLPPEELSGLGQVLGSAITEEADSGLTAIKLGFRMSKAESAAPPGASSGQVADSVSADPNRLTLRAVLHYLWQEAELATWSPGMAGKRNWRVVSWNLRQAETALEGRRRFTKSLRYNLASDKPMASLVFTDTETPTAAFLLTSHEARDAVTEITTDSGTHVWTWVIGDDMPALPSMARVVDPTPHDIRDQ